MILITGSNGNLGQLTIQFLRKKNPALKIAGLVRESSKGKALQENGVELRVGAYGDRASLVRAFKGIETLLFISSSELTNRIAAHQNVIAAAKEAGVKHLVYTSLVQADKLLSPLAADHLETEKQIIQSGIPYTFFRNTFYAEFIPMFIGKAHETGEWFFPGDQAKVNFALRSEMAEAIANVLENPAAHRNTVYEITSGNSYSLSEIADIMGEISGKEVRYTHVPVNVFKEQLTKAGLPAEMIEMTTIIGESFVNGALSHSDDTLEKLLGRKPIGTREFLNQYLSNKN